MLFAPVIAIIALFLLVSLYAYIGSVPIFVNLVILVAMCFIIAKELKQRDYHKYFLFSLLLTAIFFILSATTPIKDFIEFKNAA